MDTDLFASRLAARLRLPIAAVGVASLLLAIANLFLHVVDDQVIVVAATAVGVAAAGMFLSAVFDMRFQRAVSALNAERRTKARENGRLSRLTGWGLPVGDRLLVTISLPLLVMTLVSANYFHRLSATALLFAAFALVGLAQMALMVRAQPTDAGLIRSASGSFRPIPAVSSIPPPTVNVEMNRPESLPNGLSEVSVGSIVASRQTGRMGGAHPPDLDFPDFHDERRVFGSNVVVSANQGVGLLTNWTKGLKLHAEIGGFGARNKKPVFMVAPLRDYSTVSRNRNIVVGANTRTDGKPRPPRHDNAFASY